MSIFLGFAAFIAAMVTCVALDLELLLAVLLGTLLFGVIGFFRGTAPAQMWQGMWREGRKLLPVLGIFVCIGAITALWRSCGTIAFFIYYGVQLITPPMFILVAFGLTCLLSYALGTSFGVVGTAGIILMALARSGGVDPLVTAGAVMSGAYFGDRCSPASSSATLVAAVTETKLYDNLRAMIRTGWLPLAATIAVYGVLSAANPIGAVDDTMLQALDRGFRLSWWTLLPAVLMLLLPLLRVPVRIAMLCSSLTALAMTVVLQGMALPQALWAAVAGYTPQEELLGAVLSGGGILSMVKSAILVMATGMFSGLLMAIGALDGVKGQVERLAVRWGLFPTMVAVGLLSGMVFCNQSIMCMLGAPLLQDAYESQGADRNRLALDLENSSIVLASVIPWNIACSIPLQMLGAGSGAVLYTVLPYMIPLCYGLTLMGRRRVWQERKV